MIWRDAFAKGERDKNMVCANFAHTTQHDAIEGHKSVTNCNQLNLLCYVPESVQEKRQQIVGEIRIEETPPSRWRFKEQFIEKFDNVERISGGGQFVPLLAYQL